MKNKTKVTLIKILAYTSGLVLIFVLIFAARWDFFSTNEIEERMNELIMLICLAILGINLAPLMLLIYTTNLPPIKF